MPSIEIFKHDPKIESVAAGGVVFREGDDATVMYVVVEGEVELRLRHVLLEVAEAGSVFGEMAIVDASKRSGSAIARTAARIVPIDRRRFLYLVENTPYFAIEVMRTLSRRLRVLDAAR